MCLTLAVALLAGGIPAAAYQALGSISFTDFSTDGESPESGTSAAAPEIFDDDNFEVVGEESSLRTETGKVFRLSDGGYAAVDYGRAVHYLDDGEWQDYDNSLTYTTASDEFDTAGYENASSDLRVRFSPNSASGHLVRIQTEHGSIRLSLAGAEKSRQAILCESSSQDENSADNDPLSLDNLTSGVIYRDILDNTDIEYRLDGGALKENIIVHAAKRGDYSYTFELKLNGLTPVLENDGDVRLVDAETDETALVIPKGYMYDAAGADSAAVSYSLAESNGNRWLLTVTADSTWINSPDRVFPVTVDPTVVRTNHTVYSNIKDCYVYDGQTDANGSYAWMYAGYTGGKAYYSLVGIRALPELPASAVVIRATLGLRAIEVLGGSVTLSAHAVTGEWESGTAVWSTKPSFDSVVLDYRTIDGNGTYDFDITSLAQDWYAGREQSANGVLLRELTASTGNRVKLSTANNSNYNAAHPIFVVEYRDAKGLEGIWSYSTHSLGESGTGYVNRFNGNLVYNYGDTVTDGNILPVTVGHVFNTYLAGKRFTSADGPLTADFSAMSVGRGWKLTVQESIVQRTLSTGLWLVYNDADGTEHYFYDFDNDGKFESEDGYGLTITRDTSSTSARYTLSDDYGSSKVFNSSGRLVSISDVHGNRKNLNWTNNRLTSITRTAAGSATSQTAVTFTYNSAGALTQISNVQNGDSIALQYSDTYNGTISSTSSAYLRKITRNGHQTLFSYRSDGTLDYVKNSESNQYAEYAYITLNGVIETKTQAVSDIGFSYNLTQPGQSVSFEYGRRRTTETAPGNDGVIGTADDVCTTYLFDDRGRPVCAYITDPNSEVIYAATSAVYNNYPDGDRRNNTVASDAAGGLAALNLVKNGLLDSTSSWSGSYSGSYSSAADTAKAFAGTGSLRITGQGTGSYSRAQTVYLTPGTYTFSAYLYLDDVQPVSEGGGAFLELDGEKSRVYTGTSDQSVRRGWQRVYVTKTVSAAGNYNVKMRLQNASGNAYFDCAQLESGEAPSAFNLVDNGGMNVQYRWGILNGGSYVTDSERGNVMQVTGNVSSLTFSLQTISLDLPAETSFTLSGWAKADSVPISEGDGRTFRLVAQLKYSDGVYEEQSLDFNTSVKEWQYGSVGIVPKRQGQNLTLQQVVVYLSYDRNANTARFDDISLKIEPAQLYDYDENGNLVSNYNSDGNETLLEYAENMVDIAEYTNILGEKYEYTYKTVGGVDTHLVQTVSKTDAENNTLTLTYDYDAYGNTTGSTLTSSESTYKVTSSASYTDSGNRLSAVTDASGSTVSYTYNGYGLASSVTDANGNRMGTQYDSRRRVTAVYLDADKDGTIDAAETAVHYTYDGSGRLETIETDGTEYTLVYDVHGNVTSIKAGDYTLVTNTYGANNGALLTSETGNGYETEYEYDSLGRVTGIKKNGVLKYRVTYNGDGAAFRVEDLAVGHITEYEYDGAGRLVRASKMSSGGTALLTVENKYDTYGRAVGSTYVLPGKTLSYELEYVPGSSQVEKLTLPGGEEVTYNYDAFERLSNISLPASMVDYSYESDSATGKTSNRVSSYGIWAHYPESGMYPYQYSLGYTYDANGNITEIKKGNSSYLLYEYDSLGQLTRESSYSTLNYDRYAYDKSGNRVSKNTYYWSGTLKSGETYGYTNSTWGDLLTNYDGTAITYDSSGNPQNWKNATALGWSGSRLNRASLDGQNAEEVYFTYNSDGIRTRKSFAGGLGMLPYYTTVYRTDGSKILYEQRTNDQYGSGTTWTIYYIYDTAGSVIGFEHNGTKYWYDKNLQGDITAIRNASGTLVAQYEYDAWGKHIRITDGSGNDVSDNPNHIANINPFRYRGYYFDVETGWYYLNARYYDPNVGRIP